MESFRLNPLLRLAPIIFIILIASCQSPSQSSENDALRYIYVGHPRSNHWDQERVNEKIAQIPFVDFDQVLLGGDLTPHSSAELKTMVYLDSLFDLGSENTHWALGNHDRDSLELVRQFTGRPPFYSRYSKGITWLIIDTMDSLCSMRGAQLELIRSVTDSISESSHLVLLMHQLVWLMGNPELEAQAGKIINGTVHDCPQCIHPNNFYETVYPLLKKVRERGIEVLCVAGDIGWKKREFEHLTADSIYFLASGIDDQKDENLVLSFAHWPEKRLLKWAFIPVDSLIESAP